MGVPFRPTVLPRDDTDFLSTVTRAFSEGRAFIEREAESNRREEEFQSQQRLSDLRAQGLEQDIEFNALQAGAEVQADPSLVTGDQATQSFPSSQVPTGRDNIADLEAAFAGTQQRPQLQPPGPQGIQDDFTGIDRPVQGGGAEVTPTDGPGAFENLLPIEGEQDLFGAEGGGAVQLGDIGVTAPAPGPPEAIRDIGGGTPAPPTVSNSLADELEGAQSIQPVRPGLTQVGTVSGENVFFDPDGAARGQQREASQAVQQISQILNGLAARESAAGRQDEAEAIQREMPSILAQVEAGASNPAELIQDIFARVRTNAQLQQFRDFLTNEVGEQNIPDGLNALPLAAQVEELQNVRTRINRPARSTGQTGQLTETATANGVRQLLESQGIDPTTASPQQVNEARSQFLRFARGADAGDTEASQTQQTQARRAQLGRMIPRAIQSLTELEDSEEVQALRDNLEALQTEADSLSGDQLIQAIRNVIERQREIDAARGG